MAQPQQTQHRMQKPANVLTWRAFWLRGLATTFTERKDCYHVRDRDADGLQATEQRLRYLHFG
jgi:hypothetical protein